MLYLQPSQVRLRVSIPLFKLSRSEFERRALEHKGYRVEAMVTLLVIYMAFATLFAECCSSQRQNLQLVVSFFFKLPSSTLVASRAPAGLCC